MEGNVSGDGDTPAPLENAEGKKTNQQNNMLAVVSPQLHSIPPLPSCELTDPYDGVTLPRLIEALQDRHRIRQMILQQYSDTFRSILQQLDSDIVSKEKNIHQQSNKLVEMDTVIQNNKADIEFLEKKIKFHEGKIAILQKTHKICEEDKNSLQQELQNREQRLEQELSDRRRMEQRMHGILEDTKLKWEKECDRRVNAIHMEMLNRLLVKEEKLNQVKAIILERHTPETLPLSPCVSQPQRSPSTNSCLSTEVVFACEPEGQDSRQGSQSSNTPKRADSQPRSQSKQSKRRAGCWTPQRDEAKSPAGRPVTPKGRRELPVHVPHPRLRSSGQEKWVDHKPPFNLDLGTMMQPVIPNAIEVSSPNEKALAKCEKYVLTHQEVTSDDEICTHLIKGEVIKTRGGGQAVQFTDIETLNQELFPASK